MDVPEMFRGAVAGFDARVRQIGDHLAAPKHEAAKPSDETGQTAAPDQEAA